MSQRRWLPLLVLVGSAALTAWLILRVVPRWLVPTPAVPAASVVAAVPESSGPRIKVRLFYVADDGRHLIGVEGEVPYSNQPTEQARAIVTAQLADVAAPLVSAIPAGTRLRAIYLTPQGDAYVDLSQDVATAHPGGLTNELLTIYAIVHALTINLPAVTAVQVLVDGKEVDTLAGHVDLRRPLAKHLQLVAAP